MNVWKCTCDNKSDLIWFYFLHDTLQQKIEITDLKLFLAGENTSVIIILATTIYIKKVDELLNVLVLWAFNKSKNKIIHFSLNVKFYLQNFLFCFLKV